MARDVFRDASLSDVVDEITSNTVYGRRGLALGDVYGHMRERMRACYALIYFMSLLARAYMVRPTDTILACRARTQDKSGKEGYVAAHVLPCTLWINSSEGLSAFLQNGVARTMLADSVLGKTTTVHTLVNHVDSRCEGHFDSIRIAKGKNKLVPRNGWRKELVDAVRAVIKPNADPDRLFAEHILTQFPRWADEKMQDFCSQMSVVERSHLGKPVLYREGGLPYKPRPQDFRITSRNPDPEVRAFNKEVMVQVFNIYRRANYGFNTAELSEIREFMRHILEQEQLFRQA